MSEPRILTLDIETQPNLAHVWGLWNQNIGLSQLLQSGGVMAFAAKRHGQREIMFHSDFHDGHEAMVHRAHELIDEAQIVVHFNGTSFDMPHLRSEFVTLGLTPPSPVQEVDLRLVAKKVFRFPSNKLDYVSRRLGVGGKTSHTGHALWVACLNGDEQAWNLMRRYNINDVRITERVYDKLRPWVRSHPHVGLYRGSEGDVCSRCGSDKLQRRGYAYTQLGQYPRYQCTKCGSWSRGKKSTGQAEARGIS